VKPTKTGDGLAALVATKTGRLALLNRRLRSPALLGALKTD